MIANRIREELQRPLALRIEEFFRIRVVPREAAVSDVRSLHNHDVIVAVLGKGGEETAMRLFSGFVEHVHARFDPVQAKAETANAFRSTGGGYTVGKIAVVPVSTVSLFGGDDVLIGNVGVHEFGHAISALGPKRDHGTGGVMEPVIGSGEPALHFTREFLKQF